MSHTNTAIAVKKSREHEENWFQNLNWMEIAFDGFQVMKKGDEEKMRKNL